jgi:hypothetical protein
MRVLYFLLTFLLILNWDLVAQSPYEFYLAPAFNTTKCEFTNDAIFFYGSTAIVKTDYFGNIIWSKYSNAFSRLIIKDESVYASDGINIYKFDTAGNAIWKKNFSAPVNPVNVNSNVISDFIYDGRKLFLSVKQLSSQIPFDPITQAIITLDTSGNIINAVSDTAFPLLESRIGSGSLKGGGWLALYDLSGMAHGSSLVRIDSSGNFLQTGSTLEFGGAITEIQEIIPMADSTYFVVCNENGPSASFTAAKIREDGSIVWTNNYRVDVTPTHAYYFTSDSLNNIYILGYATLRWDFIPIAIKLNSSGDVVISKSWSYSSYGSGKITFGNGNAYFFNGMHFKDNSIYCIGALTSIGSSTAILAFDTLFNNSCYTPDSNINLNKSIGGGWGFIPAPLPQFPYTALNSIFNISSSNLPVKHDLCILLKSENNFSPKEFVSVSPNPFISSLLIEFARPSKEKGELKIINALGEVLIKKELFLENQTLNLQEIPSGIYFFVLQTDKKNFTQKIVK